MRVGSAIVYVEQEGEPLEIQTDDRFYPASPPSTTEAFEEASKILQECVRVVGERVEGLAEKLEIHYTPKHGSWLNMAETELSVLSRQCLDRRVPDFETLEAEAAAWQKRREARGGQIDRRFRTEDARIKLKRLYPSLKE